MSTDTTFPDACACILAGGLSSRMGAGFKPLLTLDGQSALALLADTFRRAGITNIVVATGHRGVEVTAEATRIGIRSAYNPEYETGMFSTVKTALAAVPQTCRRICLTPVDIPLFRPATVARLVARLGEADAPPVLYPVFSGERGHPPCLDASVIPSVMAHVGNGGLRQALAPFAFEEIAVPDANILADMDTPEDYAMLRSLAERRDIPTPAEAEALLAIEKVPPQGLAHARGVAAVAEALGRALNAAGANLDIPLIKASALLHDVAKGRPHHEAAGGRLLASLGFDAAAAIVAAHRDIDLPPDAPVTEREVVYIADKFVFGRWLVPVAGRFRQKFDLFAGDAAAQAAISRRREHALRVLARIEAAVGQRAETVIAAAGFRPGPPPAQAYAAAAARHTSHKSPEAPRH
ncbi:metal dependent phosphohydrolase [Solidesulfovibrio fructosivorans JJ]]|uniref:Metal dependent phosphohydrolase n=1 Tax=Solidesulfovibrio fructosivorans JJ] TaxID=596151 RepID=E1JYE8_SOLFR|nr:NTP transferase domain-containing protein [Solidesulfovibrio fructosivorans]EFL50627.1 metal dependent phosphohydrolase [Solidesulfovibrio fructosivorans JJ]]